MVKWDLAVNAALFVSGIKQPQIAERRYFLLPEEAAKLIGKADAPVIFEVERGAIKRYAYAIVAS